MMYVMSDCKAINKLSGVFKEYEVEDNNHTTYEQAFEPPDLENKLIDPFQVETVLGLVR